MALNPLKNRKTLADCRFPGHISRADNKIAICVIITSYVIGNFYDPDIQAVLDKTEQSAGEIIACKAQIPAGFIAVIPDTERNKIGLHAEQ